VGLGPFTPLVVFVLLALGSIDDPFGGPGEPIPIENGPGGPPASQTFGREFCEIGPSGEEAPAESRIAVERDGVAPGEAAFARVEAGRDGATFGAEYAVERFVGGGWERVPDGPRAFIQVELTLGPGESGYCNRYAVPDDAPPGRYRFSRDLGEGEAAPKRPRHAEFRVSR
jgi:hypothetical protein